MIPLIASFVSLALAPWLYRLANRNAKAHSTLERMILVVLAAVVVLHILPESFQVAGWPVLLIAVLGLIVPSILERVWHQMEGSIHWVPLIFGIIGLALHAMIDGSAFIDLGLEHGRAALLPWAVVLHRLLEGLFVWWMLYPRYGAFFPSLVLVAIGIFTVIGYMAGISYFQLLGEVDGVYSFALFQALVAGSLLHLAIDLHQHSHDHGHHDRSH